MKIHQFVFWKSCKVVFEMVWGIVAKRINWAALPSLLRVLKIKGDKKVERPPLYPHLSVH